MRERGRGREGGRERESEEKERERDDDDDVMMNIFLDQFLAGCWQYYRKGAYIIHMITM